LPVKSSVSGYDSPESYIAHGTALGGLAHGLPIDAGKSA
jgi:hypothetical protein